ncbi:MAG: DsbA family oxidoreductase, partial [Bradymonadaceae bacterium]
WRSFELDPTAPAVFETSLTELLSKKYGMSLVQARKMQDDMTRVAADEGLEFHFEKARGGNTFDAHQVLHLAKTRGLGDAMKERLLKAYFTEGLATSDRDVLVELATEVGLEAGEVGEALASDAFKTAVRADEGMAHQIGVRGVPFFLIEGEYGVSGAHPSEALLSVLNQAWEEKGPGKAAKMVGGPGEHCDDDGCEMP